MKDIKVENMTLSNQLFDMMDGVKEKGVSASSNLFN